MLRVLLIDDEESLHFAFREYLCTRAFALDSARSVEEALERLSATRYDAVVADLRLRGFDDTDGLALVARARALQPGAAIVVFTACDSTLEPAAAQAGAHCFLQKPQPLSRLANVIEALDRSARHRRAGANGALGGEPAPGVDRGQRHGTGDSNA